MVNETKKVDNPPVVGAPGRAHVKKWHKNVINWQLEVVVEIMKGAERQPVNRANSEPKLMQSILKSNQPLPARDRISSSSLRSLRDFSDYSQKPTDKNYSNSFSSSSRAPSREDSPVQVVSSYKISFSQQPQKLNVDEDDPGPSLKLDLEVLVRELRQIGFDKKDPLPVNIM